MKTFLMHRDRDVDVNQQLPWNADALVADLGLQVVMDVMCAGDRNLPDVVKRTLLCGLTETDSIRYRQEILQDCLRNADVVRTLYNMANEAISNESRNFWGLRIRHADPILRRSREVLSMFFGILVEMRQLAERSEGDFSSEGFSRFFSMLRAELADDYIREVRRELRLVEFRDGMMLSGRLGRGNRGDQFGLRNYEPRPLRWFERLLPPRERGYTYYLHPRDESGARALTELCDRGMNTVADALARSADHILALFTTMRYELGFYVACLNLRDRLAKSGTPVCFPVPRDADTELRTFHELRDISLVLSTKGGVVGNDAEADGKPLLVVTGANQGGKSTFLRSVGSSQLMLECGMFVAAESLEASLSRGVFTHFKREEDVELRHGKFDEELQRMSDLADRLEPCALVLFNESFAATNDREGSEIAGQITDALLDSGVRVVFVTHLYEFAHRLWEKRRSKGVFLRADRRPDGSRTFKLRPGEPQPTSHGEDIYRRVFNEPAVVDFAKS